MLFSSVTFLFIFLPFTIIIYYSLQKCLRNWFLLFASILFYGWTEPRFLLVMAATILTNYIGTLLLDCFPKFKKIFLAFTVFIDVFILCYFKYTDFLIECFNNIFKTHFDILHIVLPLGISFFTFQAISYTVDVYRGEIKPQKNLAKLALYITLFPQLIAGPIVKYHDIAHQIDNREETLEKFYYGLRRFIIGLTRKVLIANTLGVIVDDIIAAPIYKITTWEAWLCAVCYGLQIYNDFGGYADMAIGLCAMFGFRIKENFNFPLLSLSYTEFWRRWHISLGTWVKEYIYIPLGGNRCHPVRNYFNLFISFFIIGIWHGASANMVALGVYNAVIVIIEKFTGWSKTPKSKIMKFIHHIYMIPILVISFFLLRSPNFDYTMKFIEKLLGMTHKVEAHFVFGYYVETIELVVIILSFLGAFKVLKKLLNFFAFNPRWNFIFDICLIFLLIFSASSIAISTYNPFIYFKF